MVPESFSQESPIVHPAASLRAKRWPEGRLVPQLACTAAPAYLTRGDMENSCSRRAASEEGATVAKIKVPLHDLPTDPFVLAPSVGERRWWLSGTLLPDPAFSSSTPA